MRLLLNLIWLIFGGLVLAFGYAVVALVMFILIITIPFGIASARIALTQARAWPQGRDYIAKRARQGNTKTEALRLLRRRLSDVVYRTLLIDEHAAQPELDIHTH